MPDTTQDALSQEDLAALAEVHKQLSAAGDPRSDKLRQYIQMQAEPKQTSNTFVDTLSGTAPWQQEIDKASTPESYSKDKGILGNAKAALNNLGVGATVLFGQPVAHPFRTVGSMIPTLPGGPTVPQMMNGEQPDNTPQPWGKTGAELTAMVPGVALARVGAPTAAKAADSAMAATESGLSKVSTLPSKYLPAVFDGTPESLITRAIKPGKNNVGWATDAPRALSLMKSAEEQLGHPVAGIDDALSAAKIAKKSIWQQYQARLGSGAQAGGTFDGNPIADAMMRSIDRRTAIQNPGLVARVKKVADTYRRPIRLDEGEEFLQSVNTDLNNYYAKNKVSRRVAESDPETAYMVAEGEALRKELYAKLDKLTGPGAAQLKQAYGSLTNVEKELYGRKLVADRQNPESLSEQLSTARGAGKIVKGVATLNPGDILEGTENIAVSRALKARNTSDAMIERAFRAASPAQPFPAPISPRLAGLLERGPIQTPQPPETSTVLGYRPPAYSSTTRAERLGLLLPEQTTGKIPLMAPDPGMSGGERIAALMQLLREKKQLSLPAKSTPIRLR